MNPDPLYPDDRWYNEQDLIDTFRRGYDSGFDEAIRHRIKAYAIGFVLGMAAGAVLILTMSHAAH